ncbi:MAG: hypothetical protein J0I80_08275 [Sphingomonas sp.]|nr:hypothetical protein [Sphingomonas sp.]
MIGLLPILLVIRWIAVIYACLTAITFAVLVVLGGKTMGIWPAATFAFAGAGLLHVALFLLFYFGWRKFWAWFPQLNQWLYPDIHGTWDMEIILGGLTGGGRTIDAQAIIRQDFLRISMTVFAPDSRSTSLSAVPKKDPESAFPQLHYFFLVTTNPKAGVASKSYRGSAILELDNLEAGLVTGIYWTTAETSGTYRLVNRRS